MFGGACGVVVSCVEECVAMLAGVCDKGASAATLGVVGISVGGPNDGIGMGMGMGIGTIVWAAGLGAGLESSAAGDGVVGAVAINCQVTK